MLEREGWGPHLLAPRPDGARAGWWGLSAAAEAFLDQLVTWRELGFVTAAHRPDHRAYASLPAWARATLDRHARDRRTLYLVVTDGRRPGVPGLTLAELGSFMRRELKACSALNLDGGGSSAIVVEGKVMNVPSDGPERRVANHIGVVITPPHGSRAKQ